MQKIKICLALFATFLVVNGQNNKQNGLGCATSKNSEENPSKPCILPFKYNGKKYNGCIKKDDENNKRWCATEVDNRGNFVEGSKGYCERSCPHHKKPSKLEKKT